MELQPVLRSIVSLGDLSALVTCLGHQAAWEAVPADAWQHPHNPPQRVTLVGQTGKVPWFGLESPTPERTAVLLARQISRRGKVAILLALDPLGRRLGVAAAYGRSPGLEIELDNPDPEALASLGHISGVSEESGFAFAARAADALSTEPVGRRFFRQFKSTLDRMARGLSPRIPADDRHGIVLLQLTRVLFLYFIQNKGWLAGRAQFLAQEVDSCLVHGRRIHRDFLRPLFFGTLNQPAQCRSRTAKRFGAIPFLNGGLFEPHPLERRYRADIPNPLWRDAFDGLFERFHFTVSEGDQQGSVAPDMLGRVFEGVMDPEERRASGTFYTPAVLVRQVVEAALTVHIAAKKHCTEAEAERGLENRDPEVAQILDGITVLDPAVGSGAFLLGMLERLSALGSEETPVARKRRVLQQSLFGVDRNATAVRLSELRLWLCVISDDRSESPCRVRPLPNLDCLIRQGDSLFGPAGLEAAPELYSQNRQLADRLSKLRRQVITASGPDKPGLARELRQLEGEALEGSFQAAEEQHCRIISDYLRQAREPDLFGKRRGLDRVLYGCLTQERLTLRRLRHARRRLVHQGEITWFHYQSAFADVFARGGFDLVIGNPPWLRSEAIPGTTRMRLAARYRWWRRQGRTYGNSPDLAVAFLERAFELAGPNATVAMLVPLKLATAGYGAAARHALASTCTLHVLADLTGRKEAAFEATVYPLAVVASKSSPVGDQRVRTALSPASSQNLRQSTLRGGGPWVLTRGRGLGELLADLEGHYPVLSEALTCHLGIKTGLNRVFLNPPAEIERHLLRWAVRGQDVRAFACRPKVRLLWTHDARGSPVSQLPPKARAYLAQHDAALRARRDYGGGPPWCLFRARPAVARYRVVWSDLARRLNAAALTSRTDRTRMPLNTCYLAPVGNAQRAHALAGWLNSTWIRAIAALGAVPAAGAFLRFNARVVNRLPLPPAALLDSALAEVARAGSTGKSIQPELDELVARHLGLSSLTQSALRAALGNGAGDPR